MARRSLTEEQQLAGTRKALDNLRQAKRTGRRAPIWLIPSLERREVELTLRLKRRSGARGLTGIGKF